MDNPDVRWIAVNMLNLKKLEWIIDEAVECWLQKTKTIYGIEERENGRPRNSQKLNPEQLGAFVGHQATWREKHRR